MVMRKLSILQMAYREFFLAMLNEYGVKSPAILNQEQKRKFFTRIREEWRIKKEEFARIKVIKKPISKKEQYAKVKDSKPPILLEPETSYIRTPTTHGGDVTRKILSEENPEQTDDLKIIYNPNQFFEQDNSNYEYPVVKMPQEESYLKLRI